MTETQQRLARADLVESFRQDATPGWRLKLLRPTPRSVPVSRVVRVESNAVVADRYRRMRVRDPDLAQRSEPGQFLMLTVARETAWTPCLPRPMAIYRTEPATGIVEIVYGVVGDGTRRLAEFAPGDGVHVVGPLGRGFDLDPLPRSALVIGRGIGTCSLTAAAEVLGGAGATVTAVASARDASAVIGDGEFRRAGARRVHVVTDAAGDSDPAALFARLGGELDPDPPEVILVCGSGRLIDLSVRLARRWTGTRVQASLEEHMACGLGYCHGCANGARSVGTESPLICTDGPVFELVAEATPAKAPL